MRRLILSVVALGVAWALAGADALHPYLGASQLVHSRELSAVRLQQSPLTFPLLPGTQEIRVLLNAELPPGTERQPLELWWDWGDGSPVHSRRLDVSSVFASHQPTGFFLGRVEVPSATREVRVLVDEGSEQVRLWVGATSPASAVRVLAERPRPALGRQVLESRLTAERRSKLARGAGPLPWEALPAAQRERLLDQRWIRLAPSPQRTPDSEAVTEVPRERLFLFPAPVKAATPPPPREPPVVTPSHPLAWTVEGPAVLRLEVDGGPVAVRVDTVLKVGQPHRQHAEDLLELGAGVDSVLVTAESPVSARAFSELDDGGWREVEPSELSVSMVRLQPGQSVTWTALGGAALQVEARKSLELSDGGAPASLSLVPVSPDGGVLPLATCPLEAAMSEARLGENSQTVLTEPSHCVLHLPRAATGLRLQASGAVVWARVLSQVLPPATHVARPPSAMKLPLAEGPLSWWPLVPQEQLTLMASGAWETVRRPLRLQPVAPPATRSEPLALTPLGDEPRWRVLQAAPNAQPTATRWWEGGGRAMSVQVPPGSAQQLKVAYLAPQAPESVKVTLDGVSSNLPAPTARGELSVGVLQPGAHSVQVELPSASKWWLNQQVASAKVFREAQLTGLEPGGALRYPLITAGRGKTRVAVVATADRLLRGARLSLTLDDGAPFSERSVSRQVTIAHFERELQFAPVEGAFLTRANDALLVAPAVVLTVADDVVAGRHLVSVRLLGTTQRVYVRVFTWNEP